MNNKILFSSGFQLILLAIVAFSLHSCNGTRNAVSSEKDIQKWEVVKVDKNEPPSWTIYKHNVAGTNFFEYKIEGNIEASPKACITSFKQDIYNLSNGTKLDGDFEFTTYEIVDESGDSLLTYAIHNEPFFMKDTEMNIKYIFFHDKDGSTGVKWSEAWDEHPVQPSKKLKRIESFRGSWVFMPTADNFNRAVNSVQFDLKGMPLWLAEPMVLKFLKGGLEDIRETTSK